MTIKVHEGRRYNTETAEIVAEYWNNTNGRGDFNYRHDYLYRTAKGAWFFVSSYWKMNVGFIEDEFRFPDDSEARAFMERHGKVKDIERFFEIEEA